MEGKESHLSERYFSSDIREIISVGLSKLMAKEMPEKRSEKRENK